MGRMRAPLLLLVLAAAAWADTGPSLLLRPDPRPARRALNFEVQRYLDGRLEGGASLDLTTVRADGRARVTGPEQRRVLLGYRLEHLAVDTSNPALPARLTDVSVALGAEIGRWGEWEIGAVLGIGSASNEPFGDSKGWYGLGALTAVKRLEDRARLAVLLSYDGNRGFLPHWPLPGVQYEKFAGPKLFYAVGVPYNFVRWRPAPRWELELGGIPPFGGRFRAAYGEGAWRAFLDYRTDRSYFHVEGTARRFRLRYREHAVQAGVRWEPREDVSVSLAAGWGFAREFENESDSGREFGRIGASSDPFVALRATWRF